MAPANNVAALLARVLGGTPVSDGAPDESEFAVPVDILMSGDHLVHLSAVWAGEGRPSDVQRIIERLPDVWPPRLVVTARRFSSAAIDLLDARDANWADESGRARIVEAGLIVVRDAVHAVDAPTRHTWSPSALAIAEALLAADWPRGIGTGELARAAGWSPAQVSEVLQSFDERGWTAKFGPQRGPGARRELVDVDGLLDVWTAEVTKLQHPRRFAHRLQGSDLAEFFRTELAGSLDDRAVRWAATGWIAAELAASFATHLPVLQIYVAEEDFFDGVSDVMRDTGLRAVEEGGRVEFISASPQLLAAGRRTGSMPIASAPRIYADLLAAGGRAEDVAQHVRDELIAPLHRPFHIRPPSAALVDWEATSRQRALETSAAAGHRELYAKGTWTAAYRLVTSAAAPGPRRLLDMLHASVGHETGWPVWNARLGRPRLADGVIEDWLAEDAQLDPGAADYWRARADGSLFMLRGYQEDSDRDFPGTEAGTFLDLTLPIWRTGECLLHASRMARELDAARIEFAMRWDGLAGRRLRARADLGRSMVPAGPAMENTVTTALEVRTGAVADRLPELVRNLVAPLFAVFDFFEPSREIYVEETRRMRDPLS